MDRSPGVDGAPNALSVMPGANAASDGLDAGDRSGSVRMASLLPIARASAVVAVGAIPGFMTGALAIRMRAEFELSPATLGLLVGLFFGCAAVGSGPAGRAVERIGPWRGMQLATIGAAICLSGIAVVAHDAVTVGLFLVIGGFANSIANPAANLLLVGLIPARRQGLALGIKQAAIPIATLLAGLSVPVLALTLGWRWAFGAAGVTAALISVLGRSRPGRPGERRDPVAGHADGGRIHGPSAGRLNMLLLAGGATLGIWGGQAMGTFLVSYAVDRGLPEATAGLVLSVASLAGVAARITAGWILDRRQGSGIPELAIMLGVGAVSLVLIATGHPVLVVLAPIPAFAAGWGWSGVLTYVAVRANPQAPAAATGITQAGVFLGATLGVPLFGALVQATSYATGWVATAISALVAMSIIVVVGRRLPRTGVA